MLQLHQRSPLTRYRPTSLPAACVRAAIATAYVVLKFDLDQSRRCAKYCKCLNLGALMHGFLERTAQRCTSGVHGQAALNARGAAARDGTRIRLRNQARTYFRPASSGQSSCLLEGVTQMHAGAPHQTLISRGMAAKSHLARLSGQVRRARATARSNAR